MVGCTHCWLYWYGSWYHFGINMVLGCPVELRGFQLFLFEKTKFMYNKSETKVHVIFLWQYKCSSVQYTSTQNYRHVLKYKISCHHTSSSLYMCQYKSFRILFVQVVDRVFRYNVYVVFTLSFCFLDNIHVFIQTISTYVQ